VRQACLAADLISFWPCSAQAQDRHQGVIDTPQFLRVDPTEEFAEAPDIHRAGLFHQEPGPLIAHLDLGTE